MPAYQREPATAALTTLARGAISVVGQVVESSNYTFLVDIVDDEQTLQGIYKPADGEQPLDDFPPGLYRREVAAYVLARELGWPNIPETVVRDDAQFGTGSVQRFIDADFSEHYFTFGERETLQDQLRAIAVFDLITNNTDRKSGHCLLDKTDTVWCIDHGLTFHSEPKVRTVLWDYADEPIAAPLLDDIRRVMNTPLEVLDDLLDPTEIAAVRQRAAALLEAPVFPAPVSQRQYPWPLV